MQDDVAPFPATEARRIIETELGVRLSKAFAEFEDEPLAAASLAQVHRAVLPSGREVVVKVQRPDLYRDISTDLDILARLAAGAEKVSTIGRRVGLRDWVAQLRETMMGELDYRQEADNLEIMGRYVAPYPDLFVPAPVRDYCTGRVLTMDRVQGDKVTRAARLRSLEEPVRKLAHSLMSAYLDQVFVHGLIHADPHPGNVLITRDNRLAIIDLGMVAYLGPRLRDDLFKLLLAAVDGRGDDVAATFGNIGTRLPDFDADGFERHVTRLVARYGAASAGTDSSVSEGRLVLELTRLGAVHGLRPPAELTLLGKTLLNLESVSTALDPQLDVRKVVEGHLQQVMQARLFRIGSGANVAAMAVEVQTLARDLPRLSRSALEIVAGNRLRVHVAGLEESRLIESMQKIANRITAGVIIAALCLGAAITMDLEAGPDLLGYPAIAITQLAIAILIAATVLFASRRDRPAPERRGRGSNAT